MLLSFFGLGKKVVVSRNERALVLFLTYHFHPIFGMKVNITKYLIVERPNHPCIFLLFLFFLGHDCKCITLFHFLSSHLIDTQEHKKISSFLHLHSISFLHFHFLYISLLNLTREQSVNGHIINLRLTKVTTNNRYICLVLSDLFITLRWISLF